MTSLFNGGGDTPQVTPFLPRFKAGGLTGSVGSSGSATVTPSNQRTSLVSGLSDTYQTLGNEFGDLRSTVAPGYNDLLAARLTQVNDASRKAIGTLRQNLATRRILGSSFGMDTLSRLNAEFSRQRDQVIADNFLRSLDARTKLLGQQYNAYASQFTTGLDELNLEKDIGQTLALRGADILNKTQQINADLEAKSQAGSGEFLGTLLGMGTKLALAPVTGGGSLLGSLFGK